MDRAGGAGRRAAPGGSCAGAWGGDFFLGAPGRLGETLCKQEEVGRLPTPQKPPTPGSKEGLSHCSCLKYLFSKSSGYRGISQPRSRSQLSGPAESRIHAKKEPWGCCGRQSPTVPSCPGGGWAGRKAVTMVRQEARRLLSAFPRAVSQAGLGAHPEPWSPCPARAVPCAPQKDKTAFAGCWCAAQLGNLLCKMTPPSCQAEALLS